MVARTVLLLLIFFFTACADAPIQGNGLARLGFYSDSEAIYRELGPRKKTCHEYFLLGQACKEKKLYKEAIFNFANSCFSSHTTEKLTLYASPVYNYVRGFHFKSPLYDEALYEIADLFMRYREYPYVVKFCDSMSDDLPGLWYESRLLKAQALADSGKVEECLEVYSELMDEYRQRPQRQMVHIKRASLFERTEKYRESLEEYYRAVDAGTDSWEARLAAGRMLAVSEKASLPIPAQALAKTAVSLYFDGQFAQSLGLLRDERIPAEHTALKNEYSVRCLARTKGETAARAAARDLAPDNSTDESLLCAIADELWKSGNKSRAIAAYKEIIGSRGGACQKQALARVALYYSETRTGDYATWLRRYKETYSDDTAELCLWLLGRDSLRSGDRVSAAAYFRESLEKYPLGQYSDKNRFWLYRVVAGSGNTAAAAEIFMDMVIREPDSSYTWAAIDEALKKTGAADLAREYNTALSRGDEKRALLNHSLLYAADNDTGAKESRLNDMAGPAKAYAELEKDIVSDRFRSGSGDILAGLEKYFIAGHLGAVYRELHFLPDDERTKEDTHLALARYARTYGHYHMGINSLHELLKGRKLKENIFLSPLSFMRQLYPLGFAECVEEKAAKKGLDAKYVYAVIKAESNFNHQAVSPAGAIGLMQLMPPTAGDVARELKVSDYNLKDPCTSITFGSHYLAWLMRFFRGDITYSIGGYNAGAGNVQKWLKTIPSDDPLYFIEFVPFDETRGYMLRTARFYRQYTMLYNDKPASESGP